MTTTNEAETLTGATFRQLDYWSRRGILKPANDDMGSGSSRQWPPEEINVARTIVRLLNAGLTLDTAAPIAREQNTCTHLAPGILLIVAPDG